ncbi:MAG: hypothetical protein P9M14_06700 [Candidatus Alcyoniella australis]|nr:hypothetical protein [Candidatus Alcyoniella australis]
MSDASGPVQATGWAEKFEELADSIPVLRGYRAKEKFRDADKLLREHTVGRINAVKNALERIKSERVESGKLSMLDLLDKLTRKLDRVRDTHRFAAYGYSGYFDPQKIKEPQLAALYDYDRKILDLVEQLVLEADAWAKADLPDPEIKNRIHEFDGSIDRLEQFAGLRKDSFNQI